MKIKYQATLLTVALALGSCSSDEMFDNGSGSMGSVTKPGVEVNNVENVVKGAPSRASYDISNYILDFYRAGEEAPFMSSAYNKLNATIDLPAGDYKISVRSHNVQKAEWDNPYFTGASEQFTVEADKITTVKPITCTFSSIKVTVQFGEKLRAMLGDDVQVTVIANDEGRLIFTPAETRAGYFEAINGSATMVVTFTGKVNGYTESFSRTFTDVAAGQHRVITFNAGGELPEPDVPQGTIDLGNGLKINISYTDENIDGSVDPGDEDTIVDGEKEPGTLPDVPDPDKPDDGEQGGDPETSNFTFGGTLQNGGTYTNTELSEYTVAVDSKEPIEAFDVKIESTSLTPEALSDVGLADQFSLSNPGEFTNAVLGLGFPCGDGSLQRENPETHEMEPVPAVLNATHVDISVTSFMDLLAALGPSTSTFYMTVTAGGETKTISFTIVVE